MRATCPKCDEVIESDLAGMTKHVKGCGRASGKLKTVKATAQPIPNLPLTVLVPKRIESQNASQYDTWHTYSRIKHGWKRSLAPLVRQARLQDIQLDYSEWEIHREFGAPKREFDYANLVGGCKPIPDILIELGVIVDDSPKHFHCDYFQDRCDVDVASTRIVLLSGRR